MPESVSQYIFGNSLVNYAEGGPLTNVPVWLDYIASAAGTSYAVSGGYGFLRQFADREEPGSEWGFQGVSASWDSEARSFEDATLDSIVITPANFIQDQAPDANYAGDSRSPLDATLDIIADSQAAHPMAQIYIYEGWADLGPFASDVPSSAADLTEYHAYNSGAYHDWYTGFVDDLNAADPDADVTLIPVGSVLSDIMTGPLFGMSPETFFVDTAPHGTETTYFLASLITYTSVYGELPPRDLMLPDDIDARVAARYDDILDQIALSMSGMIEDDLPPPMTPDDDGADEDGEMAEPEFVPQQAEPNPIVEVNPEFADLPEPVLPAPDPVTAVEDSKGSEAVEARDDSASVQMGDDIALDVLANDSGDLKLVHVDAPEFGTADLIGNVVLYGAPDDGPAQDAFHYTAVDADGTVFEAEVTVDLEAPEPPPLQANIEGPSPDTPGNLQGWDETGTVFEGMLSVTESGTYGLSLFSDGPVAAWIDGQDLALVGEEGSLISKATVDLEAGTYAFGLAYGAGNGGEEVALTFTGPGSVMLSGAEEMAADGAELYAELSRDDVGFEDDPAEDELLDDPADAA